MPCSPSPPSAAASSAVYLFNDLRDREDDRRHPLKRLRPLAAGTLTAPVAIAAMALLAAGALAAAGRLGRRPRRPRRLPGRSTCSTPTWLKHVVILDVMSIALGFVLRVLGGADGDRRPGLGWLFLCTIFLSLFLAFSKRRHEITLLAGEAAGQRRVLDHYSPAFLDQMINVVTASSVVSYALYVGRSRDGREVPHRSTSSTPSPWCSSASSAIST